MSAPKKIDAWWFSASDCLPHGDGRLIVVGESHSVGGDIVLCDNALHASRDPFDALTYAPGQYLYRVRCWGDVVEDDDKLGARYREYVDMRNATNTLRKFAREQALSVIHFWEAPPVVKEYLEAGDETLRAAACTASREAARAATGAAAGAACTAACTAAGTAAAAWAAWAAACTAADAAWAAGDAARAAARAAADAARAAAWAAAKKRFNEMVVDLFMGGRQS